MRITEAIAVFLRSQPFSTGIPWTAEMETQLNVAADHGEPVAGKRNTFSDGLCEWFNIRIPRSAHSEPHFEDYETPFPLERHVEAIGCTGWNWRQRCSLWAGFDFDSITGHAAGVGISDQELDRVRELASGLDYVEVRRSTGGKGIHLYVYFDGIPTANHHEHAALARAVLGMMSTEAGFDFAAQVDVCGGNMWIWHRKVSSENQGLTVIKPASKVLTEADLPLNWRDHVEVVTRRRSKVRLRGWPDEFEQLAAARPVVTLDEQHRKVIASLMESGYSTIWVSDHNLLQTHTAALAKVHASLGLKGMFRTTSDGRDPCTPNCYLFSEPHGAWAVYRYGQRTAEHPLWRQQGAWTTCRYNAPLDLPTVARVCQGCEDPERDGFLFPTAESATKAAQLLGINLKLPEVFQSRQAQFKAHKDGRLIVEIPRSSAHDPAHISGWVPKRSKWICIFEANLNDRGNGRNSTNSVNGNFDEMVRHLIAFNGYDAGWALRSKALTWHREAKDNLRSALHFMGYTRPEIETILGHAVFDPWKLVNLPFQPEYPGDRQWNRDAAQLVYPPADEPGEHPHWDAVLSHCFGDLDERLRELDWARDNNIKCGRDYGELWIACLIREPFEPLPYLFLYGEQNSGKSILHEAIALLMTSGVAKADSALTNPNQFNGELEHCVLAFVEETDLGASADTAYTRIKDWTTSRTFWVRKMRVDRFPQPNTLHFIQCANHRSACPVFPHDTRIIVMHVPPLEQEIPKSILVDSLKQEAPAFMRSIMDRPLPTHVGRLRIPVIETESKAQVQREYLPQVERFIEECTQSTEDRTDRILFAEFYDRFREWVPPAERDPWTKYRVSLSLPDRYSTSKSTKGAMVIRGLKWRDDEG